jgi:hypothetical protein
MTPSRLEDIMADIAEGDPLDFGELSISEEAARHIMAIHLCEVDRQLLEAGLDAEERLAFMAAIAAHALTENMVLNVEKLKRARADGADFRDWMRRHGVGGGE